MPVSILDRLVALNSGGRWRGATFCAAYFVLHIPVVVELNQHDYTIYMGESISGFFAFEQLRSEPMGNTWSIRVYSVPS